MLFGRSAKNGFILAVLAGLIATSGARAETAINKSDILNQLTRAGVSQLPERTSRLHGNYPEAVTQLELDLIVFRWASRQLTMPANIKNGDAIIAALQKSVGDPVVNYAADSFAVNSHDHTAVRPQGKNTVIQDLDQIKELVGEGIASRESSPAKAAESLTEAVRVCQEMYLDLAAAAILKELGDIHQYDMSRYHQAESFYDRASSTFQSYRCAASSAAVYDGWGMLFMAVGRYADSAELYTEAARQWEDLVKEDPRQFGNRDKAGLAYIRAGKAKEADGDYAGAYDLMTKHGLFQLHNWSFATKSYDLLVRNLIIVAAFVRERMSDTKDAIALLNAARDAARLQADPLLSARVYEELGKVYSSQGSPNAAPALAKQAKCLWNAATAGDRALSRIAAQPAITRSDLTDLLVQVERAANAYGQLGRMAKSADLWRKAADAYGGAGLVEEQLSCLHSLAATLDEMKKPSESIQCRTEAVRIASKTGRNSTAADIIMALVQTSRDQNDVQNALEGLNDLVTLSISTGKSRQAAEALEARGSLLVELNHNADAVGDFRAAVDKLTTLVGDVWSAGHVAMELAAAQTAVGQTNDARATLTGALANTEATYGAENPRASGYPEHTRVVTQLYGALIENHVRAKDVNGALGVVRRAVRYPWSSDLMHELRSSPDAAVSEFARRNDLVRETPEPTDASGTTRMLAKDGSDYVTTCWKVEQNNSAAYGALPVDPLQLYRVRAAIPKDTAVVIYIATDFCVYAFICTRDRCAVWQLDSTGVAESISKLRRTLEYCEQGVSTGVPVPPMIDWQAPAFLEIKGPLVALYGRLIAPITETLKDTDKLVFALPKEFEALPVEAMISGEKDGAPAFLVQERQISYLGKGMLDDLVNEKSREVYPSLDSLAIFADPEDNLPGARKEATAIKSNYLNSRWYVGSERATAANFLAECERSGIIHVAAHHRVSANSFGFEIILAPDPSSDGIVGSQQLLALQRVSLELVVLSACDTVGSSDPVSTGPTRAAELFSVAGAKSVLGALWKVSDDAASQIFGEFYKNLSKGKSRAESLRLAQLSVIESKRFAHPFYWACFALYGNPR